MIPNPIHKVLFSMQQRRVRALLMGGQACVLYGAAEFSRDVDFAILINPANLARLNQVLADLDAHVIAVPPYKPEYLRKGHAVHFRCRHPEIDGLRIDVMTAMRNVEAFANLWKRRLTLSLEDGTVCELISLRDLVKAKKTQRDKDWPMVRRLVENDYFNCRDHPSRGQIQFWLLELRTPELLIELAESHPTFRKKETPHRPLLKLATRGNQEALSRALLEEEYAERRKDLEYWAPLKKELEQLRYAAHRNRPS